MPELYLGMAASNDDCDALASHAGNRLQSDRDDRCQDSRRHFPFVAEGGAGASWIRANASRPLDETQQRLGVRRTPRAA
jgi:hypothetical protein